ncbi:MAG: D-2-hydroxyacid dehydrogenase [Planctomycetaceae bacterium]|nr:D-2-hydroxyacid dehydrogenase [Planctomycetaceae bacterium]
MSLLLFPGVEPPRYEQIVRAAGPLRVVNVSDRDAALAAMPDATGFFGNLTPELLTVSTKLQWVQTPTVSLEHYMFPELVEHPCVVTNMRGLFSDVIADHVMGFVLSFCRNLHLYVRRQIEHRYEPIGGDEDRAKPTTGPSYVCNFDRMHRHVADQTLGVVGVGEIGAEICRRAAAFRMTVLGVDPKPRSIDDVVDVWPNERLDEMISLCDFIVIAAPHTPETERLFDADRIAKMKAGSFLINIGRGAIVDLTALTESLRSGHLGGAALDVFEIEPLPKEHPLWDFENVLITPHVAAASPRIAERHLATLLENVRRFAVGEPLINAVDKAAWY